MLSLTSGRRYNFIVRCIVMFLLRWENFTSISLRGFNERCQYLCIDIRFVTDTSQKNREGCVHAWRAILSDPPACAHRFRQNHSSSVDRLKDTLQVDPSGDFSNQNRSNSFGAKLLVDAEEVDLNHFLFSVAKENRKTLLHGRPIVLIS